MRQEIFRCNCDKIGLLPPEIARSVIDTYGNIDSWNKFAEHFKSSEFKAANRAAQEDMVKYFIETDEKVHKTAEAALKKLK